MTNYPISNQVGLTTLGKMWQLLPNVSKSTLEKCTSSGDPSRFETRQASKAFPEKKSRNNAIMNTHKKKTKQNAIDTIKAVSSVSPTTTAYSFDVSFFLDELPIVSHLKTKSKTKNMFVCVGSAGTVFFFKT